MIGIGCSRINDINLLKQNSTRTATHIQSQNFHRKRALERKILAPKFRLQIEQIKAVQEILPDLNVVDDRGGKVFKVGKYFSEDYAEAVCKKYLALGLYSGSSKIKVDLSEQ